MAKSSTRSAVGPAPSIATPRRAHWRGVLKDCARSGLSQAEFCRRRGIPPGTLAFWKHTLMREAAAPARRAGPSAPPPAFLPVRIVSAPSAWPAAVGGDVEIVLASARVVRVRGPVDVAWLGQLVRALEVAPC